MPLTRRQQKEIAEIARKELVSDFVNTEAKLKTLDETMQTLNEANVFLTQKVTDLEITVKSLKPL